MQYLIEIFGDSKDLTVQQMSCRGVVVFIVCLILIRISGRRSFGIRTALDNIIVIMLGAILSRAVVGASPFCSVIVTSFLFVLLHRMLAWGIVHSPRFSRLVEGNKIILFDNNTINKDHMDKALVCEEDMMQGVRKSALTKDMGKIDKVYMERNGEISAVKKKEH